MGHLIYTFSGNIETVLNVDDLMLIIRRDNELTKIVEYEITDRYEVIETRVYPLYNYTICRNGDHTSDGKFIYIEVEGSKNLHEYLIYTPTLSSTNILTHKIKKLASHIKFVQSIGEFKHQKYRYSLAINGEMLFSATIPNIVLQFASNAKRKHMSPN